MTDEQFDTRLTEWSGLPLKERLRLSSIYQQQYPMGKCIFAFRKYMTEGVHPLQAYLRWVWADKGL